MLLMRINNFRLRSGFWSQWGARGVEMWLGSHSVRFLRARNEAFPHRLGADGSGLKIYTEKKFQKGSLCFAMLVDARQWRWLWE